MDRTGRRRLPRAALLPTAWQIPAAPSKRTQAAFGPRPIDFRIERQEEVLSSSKRPIFQPLRVCWDWSAAAAADAGCGRSLSKTSQIPIDCGTTVSRRRIDFLEGRSSSEGRGENGGERGEVAVDIGEDRRRVPQSRFQWEASRPTDGPNVSWTRSARVGGGAGAIGENREDDCVAVRELIAARRALRHLE